MANNEIFGLPRRFRSPVPLGEGTFGKVYLCFDTTKKRQVALKVYKDPYEYGFSVECVREIAHLRRASESPRVVCGHDVVIRGRQLVVVMEAMKGSLKDHLRLGAPDGRASHADALRYARDFVAGLAWFGDNDVMHRDVKLQNILIGTDGVCKVGDLGSARHYQKGRTYTLNVCTLPFRAPEILYGDDRYDLVVDVWAVGCTIYELLTGGILFPSDGTQVDQLNAIAKTIGTPHPDIWEGLDALPFYRSDVPNWKVPNEQEDGPDALFRRGTALPLAPFWMHILRMCIAPPRRRTSMRALLSVLDEASSAETTTIAATATVATRTRPMRELRKLVFDRWRTVGAPSVLSVLARTHSQWQGRPDSYHYALDVLCHLSESVSPRSFAVAQSFAVASLLLAYKMNEVDMSVAYDYLEEVDEKICDAILGAEFQLVNVLDWNVALCVPSSSVQRTPATKRRRALFAPTDTSSP
jgi:serine/threonine protein kinase